MKHMFLVLMGVLCLSLPVRAYSKGQDDVDGMQKVMRLVGAQAPEDVGEDEYERLSRYLSHPLPVNLISRDRLAASGLVTVYQAASLADYRSRHGDVLSAAELALVDGFSEETVSRLAPFISFYSDAVPGNTSYGSSRIRSEAVVRGGWKRKGEDNTYSYGLKYRLQAGERYDAGLSLSRAFSDKVHWPAAQSFFFSYNGRRCLSRLLVGDYNLRYGQGLAMWTGFSISGPGAPSSVFRRPSGVTPYWSWSGAGSRRGVAAEVGLGPVSLSASVAADGLREMMAGVTAAPLALSPVMNIGWLWRNLQLSATFEATTADLLREAGSGNARASPGSGDADLVEGVKAAFDGMKVAADFAWCVRGTDVFGEVAYDIIGSSPAAVFGSRFRCGEQLTLAVCGRYYPAAYSASNAGAVRSGSRCSNEHGVSVTGEFAAGRRISLKGQEGFGSSVRRHDGSFSADAAFFPEKKSGMPPRSWQIKTVLNYNIYVSPSVSLNFRLGERIRGPVQAVFRTDARADVKYLNGDWNATLRLNALYGSSLSLLTYLEGGYRSGRLSVYARAGAFMVDSWDDRIYAYERDAPGSFNVPAFYGRGYWLSASAGVKCARWLRAYLRASLTGYPWMPQGKEKPGNAELKIQFAVDL